MNLENPSNHVSMTKHFLTALDNVYRPFSLLKYPAHPSNSHSQLIMSISQDNIHLCFFVKCKIHKSSCKILMLLPCWTNRRLWKRPPRSIATHLPGILQLATDQILCTEFSSPPSSGIVILLGVCSFLPTLAEHIHPDSRIWDLLQKHSRFDFHCGPHPRSTHSQIQLLADSPLGLLTGTPNQTVSKLSFSQVTTSSVHTIPPPLCEVTPSFLLLWTQLSEPRFTVVFNQ